MFSPIDERARILLVLQALWAWVAFWAPLSAVLAAIGAWGIEDGGWLVKGAGILAVVQGVRALVWPVLAWPAWGWRLDDAVVQIRHGVFFRVTSAIPLARVQHVDVRQDPLERLLGLARVQIHTASGLGADGVVPGLDPEVAERLRVALTRAPAAGDGV